MDILQYAVLLSLIAGVDSWKCAKYQHYFSQQPDYIDCFWNCCGNSFNRHCCTPVVVIASCLIAGGIVLSAILVFVCCFWKRENRYNHPLFTYRRPMSTFPIAPSTVISPAPYVPITSKPAKGEFFT